jgi:hypothetical protein
LDTGDGNAPPLKQIERRGRGSEYQSIRGSYDVEKAGPNSRTEALQAFVTYRMLFDLNIELETLGRRPQHVQRRGCNFRPNAVTGQNDNAHGDSLGSPYRLCEERSDEAIHAFFAALDCFAEPVIGRAFARPLGSQ